MPHTRNALLLLSLTLAGCCSSTPSHSQTTTPAPSLFTSQPPPPHLFLHTDTFTTPLTPTDAAYQVSNLFFNAFGFSQYGLNGAASGDRFFATTPAISALHQQIQATFRWHSEHETTVEFQSDLPPDQHTYLLKSLQSTLTNTPTHKPPTY